MKMFHNNRMIDLEAADALGEISNVGFGKVTSTLGGFLGERITLCAPRVLSLRTDLDAVEKGIEIDQVVVGILMRLTKTLNGIVLILVEPSFISDLVEKMTSVRYTGDQLLRDEDSLSAVQELANIMAASYMNAVGSYTRIRIYLTPMMVGMDMAGALISYPLAEMSMNGENVICIDSSFSSYSTGEKSKKQKGRMLILPDEASAQKIIDALGL